ncbi:tRNA lysidine(34) synthetase TilS [Culicoidibacter larvae]|uniref:tRNA(Ile)-lysidine synthase n=1 Tax=Culicoidibacter larvae TaxID=2579976 RepID=A0A5R8QHU4_9FIRM|nr:tRNA lysidine(34) synthetase TilS [Culicoidibacter larvae]TLG77296.1 tRNA lysidine(34) synthetase TilS [Culicoidibacter larvae]
MSSVEQRVACLELNKVQPVVVGVSTGVDSMVLLHALKQQNIAVVAVYVNHHKRPLQIPTELALLERVCGDYGFEYRIFDLPEMGAGKNFHDFAHQFRYQSFVRVAQEMQAQAILTAHHADDQVETVLMRLVRGTSPRGLAGIRPVSHFDGVKVLRPFISLTKKQVITYAAENMVEFVEDESNASEDYLRNRLRHNVVPQLMGENEQSYAHVQRLLDMVATQNRYVDKLVARCIDEVVVFSEHQMSLSRERFLLVDEDLQGLVMAELLRRYTGSDAAAEKTDLVLNWLRNGIKPNAVFYIAQNTSIIREYDIIKFAYPLVITPLNKVQLNAGMQFIDNIKIVLDNESHTEEMTGYFIEKSMVVFPLYIRAFLRGDRIQMAHGGSKKVSRIFIDKKVPQSERLQVPIIVDSQGQILIVGEYAVADSVKKHNFIGACPLYMEQVNK